MKLQIVILAAGQGTRMRSHLPKVLHRVAGKPMLQHVIDRAAELKPEQIVIVHGQNGEALQSAVPEPHLEWVLQAQQLGTGHALQQVVAGAAPTAVSHVLVLYGDVPAISAASLQAMRAKAEASVDIVVLTAQVANPYGFGRILRNSQGALLAIVEEKDASVAERQIGEINSGLLLCTLSALQRLLPQLQANNAQGEYYLTDIIGLAVREGLSVATVTVADPLEVQGVNDRCQLSQVERYYQSRQARALMQGGATLADPARIDIRGQLTVGMDVVIDINCVFEGEVQLGDGVVIGPNCLIKNSIIANNVIIHANTVIDGAKIACGVSIGPYARLRPETEVAEGCHIGNFVELKKTRFGKRSKVNHLAYLGDASVGEGVNIGAGVITCNYDGVHKHPTIIEDGVFVGADSQLVAPVRIGQGATIGAGSTITKDAPADTLTISRAKQTSIKGWCRPIK